MNHKRIQNDLSAYFDNELSPNRHKEIEAHLRSCEACAEMLSAFQKNRQMVADLSHPVPSTLKDAVMAKIHEQAAEAKIEEPARTPWLPDMGKWIPDLGRWFFRPVTAGATAVLTLALIFGALYFQPTTPQYDETLDFYFGLHTEQFTDNPLKSNVGGPLRQTATEEPQFTETVDDAERLLDLYLENGED